MISVPVAYLLFAGVGLALFRVFKPAVAALAVFLGGWVLLPVGVFPDDTANVAFPYWITGLAVPSQMLLTKAWVAPCVALVGALAFDWKTARQLRFSPFDVPVVLWCLWPLAQALVSPQADPQAFLASLYLAGAWGAPWLLGRLYFNNADGQRLLMQGMTWSALACLPIALIEGVFRPGLAYELLYGVHPFHLDGADRYLGYRPLGTFENGNQYGLWMGLCAIAAVWLARAAPAAERRNATIAAALVVAMALAAQSVGAVALMLVGLGLLFAVEYVSLKRMTIAAIAVFVLSGAVYFSGVIPVRELATQTSVGRAVVDTIKGVGRGSFTWRVSQDQKLLPLALERPLVGSAQWDWWRSEKVRPWGMPLLVTGQFGLVGLALCFGLMLAPAVRVGLHAPPRTAAHLHATTTVMATLVVLTVVDMLLNSFVFFPALIAAGGLALSWRSSAASATAKAAPLRAEFTPYRGPGTTTASPAKPIAKPPAPAPAPRPTARRPAGDDRPVRSPGDPRHG